MIQIHINTYIYVYIFVFFKRAEIESIFKEYDTNKDGVSGEKLLYLLRSLGIYLNKTESEVILLYSYDSMIEMWNSLYFYEIFAMSIIKYNLMEIN